MGKTVELAGANLAFVRSEFERYYRTVEVPPPPRYIRREFAAFPFATQTMMRRHAAFRSAEEFSGFLRSEAPRHVYYSSAYYRQPDHAKMAEKGWLGADLIFDLDADHLRHAETLDYPAQLDLVKERFRELLDEFLFGDFGIDPALTTLVFSGGRGYHVHVHDPKYLELTSPERRELVEYILGEGVDPRSALEEERARAPGGFEPTEMEGAASGGRRGRTAPRSFQRLADPSDPGWPGRISRAVLAQVAHWEAVGSEATARELEGLGLSGPEAKKIARRLIQKEGGRLIREQRTLEVFQGPVPDRFLEAVLRRAAVEVQGETDAPVTTDIHRLIRLPGSLHGGTGLVVKTLRREELERFEPLRDAVVPVPNGPPVKVRPTATVHYPFGSGTIDARQDEPVELPTAAAAFLILRGEAELTPPA